jgi:hypothetical protein
MEVDICAAEELAPGQRRIVEMGDWHRRRRRVILPAASPGLLPFHRAIHIDGDGLCARTYRIVMQSDRLYLVLGSRHLAESL